MGRDSPCPRRPTRTARKPTWTARKPTRTARKCRSWETRRDLHCWRIAHGQEASRDLPCRRVARGHVGGRGVGCEAPRSAPWSRADGRQGGGEAPRSTCRGRHAATLATESVGSRIAKGDAGVCSSWRWIERDLLSESFVETTTELVCCRPRVTRYCACAFCAWAFQWDYSQH